MSRWMQLTAGLVAATFGLVDGAAAQTSVLVRAATGCASVGCPTWVFTYDPDGQVVRSAAPVMADTGAYVTPDGGTFVALYDGGTQLSLLDRASGVETLRPLAAPAWALVGNPVRPEVYVTDTSTGLALAPSGARRLATPSCPSPVAESVSADGRRVVYKCFPGNGNPGYSAVIDTASGSLVRALPSGWSPVLNGDGTVLFQSEFEFSGVMLRRYLVDDGTRDAETVLGPYFETPYLAFDPRSQRLLSLGAQVRVFDGVTLDPLAYLACGGGASGIVFERDRPRAFVVGTFRFEPFIVSEGWLCEIDTTTFTVSARRTFRMPFGPLPSVTVAEVPRAPASLTSHVTGASVTLTWQPAGPPAAVTRYVLEVGSAPGLNDIFTGLDVGLQTSFAASGVPPGRYYVRVRAGNYAGLGAPSNEVIVQVP